MKTKVKSPARRAGRTCLVPNLSLPASHVLASSLVARVEAVEVVGGRSSLNQFWNLGVGVPEAAARERGVELVGQLGGDGSARGKIVQPFNDITTRMAVTVLKGAGYDCDNRSTRIDERLSRFRGRRAGVATTRLTACACRSSPSS